MNTNAKEEIAKSWADDIGAQLQWLNPRQRRSFFYKALQKILEEWSPAMIGSVLVAWDREYAQGVVAKINDVLAGNSYPAEDDLPSKPQKKSWWKR